MLSIAVDWLELTVRFVVRHSIRDILKVFDAADISIAITAYNIGGFPPLRIENGACPQEKGRWGKNSLLTVAGSKFLNL